MSEVGFALGGFFPCKSGRVCFFLACFGFFLPGKACLSLFSRRNIWKGWLEKFLEMTRLIPGKRPPHMEPLVSGTVRREASKSFILETTVGPTPKITVLHTHQD